MSMEKVQQQDIIVFDILTFIYSSTIKKVKNNTINYNVYNP